MPLGKSTQSKVDAEYKKFEKELMEKARLRELEKKEKVEPKPPSDREIHISGENRKKQ